MAGAWAPTPQETYWAPVRRTICTPSAPLIGVHSGCRTYYCGAAEVQGSCTFFDTPLAFLSRIRDHKIGSASACKVDKTAAYLAMSRFQLFVALCDHNPPTNIQTDRRHAMACRAKNWSFFSMCFSLSLESATSSQSTVSQSLEL